MKNLLIIGSGDIALRTALLLGARYRIFGLLRNSSRHEILNAAGVIPVPGNLDQRHSLVRLAGLAHTILHFAPPPSEGEDDPRTRNLLAALSLGTLPQRFVYISTSGVYGDVSGARLNETHVLNPQSARAQRRVNAEKRIREWAKRNQVQASILRVPGIYAADRLPLERLRMASPAIIAEQDSYTNHIHADDLARIVVATLREGKSNRVYHASDDGEMKMGEYFDVVADKFKLPRPTRLPRAEVERAVSPMLWSFMKESRRLSNDRIKKELGVKLLYPTVGDMLNEMQI